jgi:hypothetical protein
VRSFAGLLLILLLVSHASAQKCSTPPTCQTGSACFEVGSDVVVKEGKLFYWTNSFTQDRALVVFDPSPLTDNVYIVRGCQVTPAQVKDHVHPNDYPYSATGPAPCETATDCNRGQPRIRIGN